MSNFDLPEGFSEVSEAHNDFIAKENMLKSKANELKDIDNKLSEIPARLTAKKYGEEKVTLWKKERSELKKRRRELNKEVKKISVENKDIIKMDEREKLHKLAGVVGDTMPLEQIKEMDLIEYRKFEKNINYKAIKYYEKPAIILADVIIKGSVYAEKIDKLKGLHDMYSSQRKELIQDFQLLLMENAQDGIDYKPYISTTMRVFGRVFGTSALCYVVNTMEQKRKEKKKSKIAEKIKKKSSDQ